MAGFCEWGPRVRAGWSRGEGRWRRPGGSRAGCRRRRGRADRRWVLTRWQRRLGRRSQWPSPWEERGGSARWRRRAGVVERSPCGSPSEGWVRSFSILVASVCRSECKLTSGRFTSNTCNNRVNHIDGSGLPFGWINGNTLSTNCPLAAPIQSRNPNAIS